MLQWKERTPLKEAPKSKNIFVASQWKTREGKRREKKMEEGKEEKERGSNQRRRAQVHEKAQHIDEFNKEVNTQQQAWWWRPRQHTGTPLLCLLHLIFIFFHLKANSKGLGFFFFKIGISLLIVSLLTCVAADTFIYRRHGSPKLRTAVISK